MGKRMIVFLVLIALLLSLPGCGQSELPEETVPPQDERSLFLEDYDRCGRIWKKTIPSFRCWRKWAWMLPLYGTATACMCRKPPP